MSSTQSSPSSLSQSLATAREVRGFEQAAAELQGWMQEKAALVVRDICDHSPSSVQTLQQQHRRLEVRAHAHGLPAAGGSGPPEGRQEGPPSRGVPPRLQNRVELAWEILGNRTPQRRPDAPRMRGMQQVAWGEA